MKIGNTYFDLNARTYIMGILNITPDSFSDGGQHDSLDGALRHTESMIRDGADIVDIGGESTRPGSNGVSQDEELSRVIPVVEAVRKRFDIPISVDTYKAVVAEEAIKAGADLINDVWGFKSDPKMASVAAQYGAACCLMHNRNHAHYTQFLDDVIHDLGESIEIAKHAGVKAEKIIIDPGVGFAKSFTENLFIIQHLDKLHILGYPILLGTSRKRFIGAVIDEENPENRDMATAATTVAGIMKGCAFVRVHNVLLNKQAALMADSINKSRLEHG